MSMHFGYEGFTQRGDTRCFVFRGTEDHNPAVLFSIELDLPLLLESRVPLQDGPTFCLQLLTTAYVATPNCLDRFHNYRVVAEDFRPLLIERTRKAAEKASRKSPRTPYKKPSSASNLHLGTPSREQ
jgi:hypothetical protein